MSLNLSESGWEKVWWAWVRVSPVEINLSECESKWVRLRKILVSLSPSQPKVQNTFLYWLWVSYTLCCRPIVLSTHLQHCYQPYVGSRLYSRILPHTWTRYRSYDGSIFIDQRRELRKERGRRCLDLPPQTFSREVTDKNILCESSLSIKRCLLNCKLR